MPTLSSLVAMEVVIMTNSRASSDDKVCIMTGLDYQWKERVQWSIWATAHPIKMFTGFVMICIVGALFFVSVVHIWFIYTYPLGLLHWAIYDFPWATEVILKDIGKTDQYQSIRKNNIVWTMYSLVVLYVYLLYLTAMTLFNWWWY